MVAFANTDLGSGDQGTVTGETSLRSEPSYDAAVVAEIPADTAVSILDGPLTASDGSLWYSVTRLESAGYLPAGAIASASADTSSENVLVATGATPGAAARETPDVAMNTSPEQEVVAYGVVVDNTEARLPAEGLACRSEGATDADIITRIPEGATLEITGDEIVGEVASFFPVNCAAQGGFVNGDYVVLASDAETSNSIVETEVTLDEVATPTVAVEAVAQEALVIEGAPAGESLESTPAVGVEPTAAVTEEVVIPTVEPTAAEIEEVAAETVEPSPTVEPVVTDQGAAVSVEPVAGTQGTPADAAIVPTVEPSPTASVTEEVASATVEPTAVVTEEVASQTVEPTPTVASAVTEEGAAVSAEPRAGIQRPPVEEAVVTTVEPSPTAAVTEEVASATVEPTAVVTEEVAPATVEPTAAVTQEVATTATEPTPSADAPATATVQAGQTASTTQQQGTTPGSTDSSIAQSSTDGAPSSIGSAEVKGTNGAGLRCRTAPSSTSPTITVLAENSFVLVHAESRDGYLGVICAGQAGWADVDYLWSGGAEGTASSDFTAAGAYASISGTNGDGVRCRRGPSTSDAVIAVIPEGTRVLTLGAASGGWVPVNCYGYSGFVSSSFISFDGGSPAPAPSPTGSTVQVTGTGGGLRCRSTASLSGAVITILPDGTTLSTRGSASGGWLPVICAGQNGFVSTQYVTSGTGTAPAPTTPPPSGGSTTVIGWGNISGTDGMGVRCRSAASTTASVIAVIPEGTQVGLRGAASNGWMPVNCYGNSGFVSAMYVYTGTGATPAPTPSPTPAPTPAPTGLAANDNAKTTSNVNLRYSASTGAGIAAVVPAGTVVRITGSITSNFYPVDWDGLRGFLYADYLVKTSETLSERGGSAAPAPAPPTTDGGSTATGNAMVDFALRYQGYPYRWANHGPSAFDCSGFTFWVTKNVTGKDIGYGLWTQVSAGTPVSRANLQPGDLVFFQNTYKPGLSHSGVYIGNNQFIHAENETTGVRISDINSNYYGSRWYGAVRMT